MVGCVGYACGGVAHSTTYSMQQLADSTMDMLIQLIQVDCDLRSLPIPIRQKKSRMATPSDIMNMFTARHKVSWVPAGVPLTEAHQRVRRVVLQLVPARLWQLAHVDASHAHHQVPRVPTEQDGGAVGQVEEETHQAVHGGLARLDGSLGSLCQMECRAHMPLYYSHLWSLSSSAHLPTRPSQPFPRNERDSNPRDFLHSPIVVASRTRKLYGQME